MGLQQLFEGSRKLRVSLRKTFLTGLAALLPLVITIYVIARIVKMLDESLRTLIGLIPGITAVPGWFTFAVAILLVLIVGFVLATFIGRKIFYFLEVSLRRIPVINTIYSFIKQVLEFFFQKQKIRYDRVVAGEYPRKGIYSLGFVTGNGLKDLYDHSSEELITIFIPSSPTPVTGYTIMLPRREVVPVSFTIEQTFRFAISAGVIVPPLQKMPDPEEKRTPNPES